MKSMASRHKILFGVWAMLLAMVGDYLLGFGTFGTSSAPDAYMGIAWNVVPDWRYAASSVLGFVSAALFAVGATELMRVMEQKHALGESKLYCLFRVANWAGIAYFAFIHIGICMLPVVFNAGMEATGNIPTSRGSSATRFTPCGASARYRAADGRWYGSTAAAEASWPTGSKS